MRTILTVLAALLAAVAAAGAQSLRFFYPTPPASTYSVSRDRSKRWRSTTARPTYGPFGPELPVLFVRAGLDRRSSRPLPPPTPIW